MMNFMEELRNFELLHQELRFLLCISRIDGRLVNNIAVRIRYGLCHSICFAVPSTSLFSKKEKKKKKRLTTGGKYCDRRRADMSFRFQQFVLKSNERGDEVLQRVPQLRLFHTLHLQQPQFMEHERQSVWKPPAPFLPMPYMSPSFIFCAITFYPVHFFSHPMLAETSFSSFSKILSS